MKFKNTIKALLFLTLFYSVNYAGVGEGVSAVGTLSSIQPSYSNIQIGKLNITADYIVENSTNVFTASGNVKVNNLLNFDGEIVVDKNNLKIEGNCKIYLDGIPKLNEVDLYKGDFLFSVNNYSLQGKTTTANNLFDLGRLPVYIDEIEILSDGVRLEGKLKFPDIMGNLQTEINTIQINRSIGIEVIGDLSIELIKCSGFELKDMLLKFDTINDIFEGSATLVTKPISLAAEARIEKGRLDEIVVAVELGKPVPLGTTGLLLTGVNGYVANLANPPMELGLGCSVVPVGLEHIVELNEMTLSYNFGGKIGGNGNLKIFKSKLASAWFGVSTSKVGFGGEVNLYDVLLGRADVSIYKNSYNKLNFEGNLSAKLQIPKPESDVGFPLDYLVGLVGLPYTVAETDNHILNNHIWGKARLAKIFKLKYDILYENGKVEVDWSSDFKLFNFGLFKTNNLMKSAVTDRKDRFEGKSLVISPNRVMKGLSVMASKMSQTFTLSEATPLIVTRLKGDSETPQYNIKLPDGTVVTNDNVDDYPDIIYSENDMQYKGFYLIKDPQPGDYEIEILNQSTNYLDIFGAVTPPSIKVGEVNKFGSEIEINWHSVDPNNNSFVNLYYDNDNVGANGVLIARDLNPETSSYRWDMSNLETGNYYIYATIKDEVNPPAISYSLNPIMNITASAPEAPTNLLHSLTDTSVTLFWEKPSDDRMNYNIYYSTKSEINLNSESYNIGNVSSFEFTNINPGMTYNFAVTAIDSNYNESNFSNVISVSFVSLTKNNAPVILEQEFPYSAYVNKLLTYQIETFDADGDQISLILKTVPEGLTISESGILNWTPTEEQAGYNLISFIIDDSKGLKDSVEFRINVVDPATSEGTISFNKPVYCGYDEQPIIELSDVNLNISPTVVDSQLVNVSSGINETGIDLYLREISANSGIFTNIFYLSENAVGDNTLNLGKIDSLLITYDDEYPQQTVTARSYFVDSVNTVGVEDEIIFIPEKYKLGNAYPNPFNPSTTIHFELKETSNVKLMVFNSLGEMVKVLVDSEKSSGGHYVKWDATDLKNSRVGSGIYFYRFEAIGSDSKVIITKKMILLK